MKPDTRTGCSLPGIPPGTFCLVQLGLWATPLSLYPSPNLLCLPALGGVGGGEGEQSLYLLESRMIDRRS